MLKDIRVQLVLIFVTAWTLVAGTATLSDFFEYARKLLENWKWLLHRFGFLLENYSVLLSRNKKLLRRL